MRAILFGALIALAACSRSTCERVGAHVAEIGEREQAALNARVGAVVHGSFLPRLGDYGTEVAARCAKHELDDEALRCFADASTSVDVDRCEAHARLR